MPQITVDIDNETYQRLQQKSISQHSSIAEKAARILHNHARHKDQIIKELIKELDEFSESVGPQTIDSTDIIREERDRL